MSEAAEEQNRDMGQGQGQGQGQRQDQGAEVDAALAALLEAGADKFDPLGFHYLQALSRRIEAQQDSVRPILQARLATAMAAFQQRFSQARDAARSTIARSTSQHPRAANELQRLFLTGDFKAVSRYAALDARQQRPSLAALNQYLAQQSTEKTDSPGELNLGSRSELKTIRYFRNTWSRLSVDVQVNQAIEQGPENAGPLNSHLLVLRSLTTMRDISPDYLNRFMSYVDTLLCLEQTDKFNNPPRKKAAKSKVSKK